jgi:hypothetical protein
MSELSERARRREHAIKRFAARQRAIEGTVQPMEPVRNSLGLAYRRRAWISFADLADWCAAATTTAGIAEQKKAYALALHWLAVAIKNEEFERNSRSKILFLAPYVRGDNSPPRCRLTRDQFEFIQTFDFVPPELLTQLWLPCELAESWLRSHGYPMLPLGPIQRGGFSTWFDGVDGAPGPKAGEKSIGKVAWSIAERILNSNESPKRGHGRLASLVRLVISELEREGIKRQADSVRKAIGPSLREWEAKDPEL